MARISNFFQEEPLRKSDPHPKRIIKWLHYSKLRRNKAQYRDGQTAEEQRQVRERVERLADLIDADGEVIQPLLVRKTDVDEYEIIAGHSRWGACRLLVEELGKEQYAFLPCFIRDTSDVKSEFQIYSSNGYAEKTDYEKMHEIERMKYLLETYPEEFPNLQGGRFVERLEKQLGMKKTTVGEYLTISKNLGEKGMESFRNGRLKKSAAVELSALPESEQEALLEQGVISHREIKEYKKKFPKAASKQKQPALPPLPPVTACEAVTLETVLRQEEAVLEEQEKASAEASAAPPGLLRQRILVAALRLMAERERRELTEWTDSTERRE